MNERIRELADEAWVYQVRVYEDNGVRTFGEKEKVFSKEKFAELIVRECAKSADEWYQNHNDIHWDPAQHIKNHFGVE